MYLPVFYFLYNVKDVSTDILEDPVSEERYLDLNEEEDTRLGEIK